MKLNVSEAAIRWMLQKDEVKTIIVDPATGAFIAWVGNGDGRFSAVTVADNGHLVSLVLLPGDFLAFYVLELAPQGTLLVTVTEEEIEQATADIFDDLDVYFPMGGWA